MKAVLQTIRGAMLGESRLLELAGQRLAARDYAAAAADARLLLRRAPAHPRGLETLAAALIGLGDVVEAADVWRRRRALDAPGKWIVTACEDAFIDPDRGAAGAAYVAELEDVVVDTTYWAVIKGDRLYNAETYNRRMINSPLVEGRAAADERRFVVSYPAELPVVDQHCVFVGGDRNYSHWIARSLIKLGLVDAPDYAGLPLLVHQPFARFHTEYLELLGIGEERLIRAAPRSALRCRRLVVPTQLSLRPGFADGVAWLRRRLAERLGPIPAAPEDLIFVSRAGTATRVLLNEAELGAVLAPLGFRTVVPDRMSVADQIRTFARARVIVAAHGAGLTNMVFAPPGTLVLEISSTNIAPMYDFRFMAAALGQRIATVYSDDYEMDPQRAATVAEANWDYRVDLEEVLARLHAEAPELFKG